MLNEDAVRLEKLEKEMAESKTCLQEVELLKVQLESKQDEVTHLMEQVERKETEVKIMYGVIVHINFVASVHQHLQITGCVMGCSQP